MAHQSSISGSYNHKHVRFADKIASICYKKYKELPRRGKPNRREWTLLAGIVKVHGWSRDYQQEVDKLAMDVVSLGTGSKCIGHMRLSEQGDIINDSHAEVMARRGFLRYLYEQIQKHYTGKSDIFDVATPGDGIKCSIKKDITFHFFTSHTPCGDASIFPKPPYEDLEDSGESSEECEESPLLNFDETFETFDFAGATESSDSNQDFGLNAKKKFNVSLDPFDFNVASESSDSNQDFGMSCKRDCGLPTDVFDFGAGAESSDSNQDFGASKKKPSAPLDVFDFGAAEGNDSNQEFGMSGKRKPGVQTVGSKIKQIKVSPDDNTEETEYGESMSTHADLMRIDTDIYRTGAKCLKTEPQQDPQLPGSQYHVVGPVRTKPGRGDPTLSVSCSDKLSRWNAVGIQGALLSLFLSAPIYLQSIVIASGCPYSEEALRRAVIDRVGKHILNLDVAYAVADPILVQATLPFVGARTDENEKCPCPSSIVWSCVKNRCLEVAVAGKKQGATKKAANTSTSRLAICKKELLKQFINIVMLLKKKGVHVPFLPRVLEENYSTQATYKYWKLRAEDYQHAWNRVRVCAFPSWLPKPDYLLHFTANDTK